jgi:predicted Co/Zn/Cd cation transporter (cation efflux family)
MYSFFPFLLLNKYFIVWAYHHLLLYSLVEEHLTCFQLLVILIVASKQDDQRFAFYIGMGFLSHMVSECLNL